MSTGTANQFGWLSSNDETCSFCEIIFKIIYVIAFCTIFFPIGPFFCIIKNEEYERAVIFRLGRALKGIKGPGLFCKWPCLDEIRKIDMRTIVGDVPRQKILTSDSVTIEVDAVCYCKIVDPYLSLVAVQHAGIATQLLVQTTMMNILGKQSLCQILANRKVTSAEMQILLDKATDPWGVKVERVEIKDVRLPHDLQRAMAAEAEAGREAKAKVIAAEGEHSSSKALRAAADVMAESNSALQLRYLQTMSTIATEKNSTIIFPLPMELLKGFKHN